MSDETASLRGERDRLQAELGRLQTVIETLRAQRADEGTTHTHATIQLNAHEQANDDALARIAVLRERYKQLVAEEQALRTQLGLL
jgi:chromosome segregation ATPase